MQIESKVFGKLNIGEEQIVHFAAGLLGFEQCRRFVFLSLPRSENIFWMQSLEQADLGFIAADPFSFYRDYSVAVPDSVQTELGIAAPDKVNIYCLVTIPDGNTAKMTINLKGPLVINVENNQAKQIVLAQEQYSTSQPLAASKDTETGTG